ncbi:N-acetylglucosamine-6-phosphate deacetylase [Ideonella sp. 4Y16]|uniref:N-acetylglucosamine-6-phosphate deacetylase n=1 Tax=Ideonella aquatica TaxID=2824119 RepID=A0A940YHL7_9BURK|nr:MULTISPECIES: N-acetylglucosamine-6-phosphate deacetylase [Ideonella]MBQ0946183.1 N-acetylglucosamine-6-phosphate deacetylase [Ideonella alba]MBQ0960393.1 N-acetylglucosamine-6-phosphate deacetylase [Ideonella aquatica]
MQLHGFILTPDGFLRGTLHCEGGRIVAIEGCSVPETQARGETMILPGFIDAHVHGGGGADVMDAGEAVLTTARTHARHGTTTLLATTMTAPLEEIEAALMALAPWCNQSVPGAANIAGVHLEGPYINPQRLGAQPDHAWVGTLQQVRSLCRLAPIRLVTLAPEVPGHLALIAALSAEGLRVQIGHSNGRYEDGVAAIEQGASGFTHLFNAMSGLHHRDPGMVGAALAHARHAEIIPDLLHVHPGAIRAALRAIPCLYCVSDSTAGAGMPDGRYRLGRHEVYKCQGGVRLADGTLAGSALTMDQALRNLVKLGLSVQEASMRVSTIAADYLGLSDRGRLVPGARADMVVLDGELSLQGVYVEGVAIDLAT